MEASIGAANNIMSKVNSIVTPGYPTTHWSQIFLAGEQDQAEGQDALDRLLRRYYPPLLAHLRFKFRATDDDARDWLQSFVEKKVLQARLLTRARRERGRFRTFLLNALDNFVLSEFRRARCASRLPDGGLMSLEEQATDAAAAPESDPFDREWAVNVIQEAGRRTRTYYKDKGSENSWAVFDVGVLQKQVEGLKPPSHADLARQFGFDSGRQVSNAIITVGRRYGAILREIIGEYVEDEAAIDAELRELMAILSGDG
jgi:RNA polymerase sigma-70 factor (ECF subfamily)